MSNCNACDNNGCGSCVAESLLKRGFLRNAGDHCNCAKNGHVDISIELNRPKVKSMFNTTRKEEETVTPRAVIEEEEIEID